MIKKKIIKGKYFTAFDYSKFTNNMLDAKVTEKELVDESDITDFEKQILMIN